MDQPRPPLMLRAVGLFQPAAGEMVEMQYCCDHPFVIEHKHFDRRFDTPATDWTEAPAAVLDGWRGPGKA